MSKACPVCGKRTFTPWDGDFLVCDGCAEILHPEELVLVRTPLTTHRYYAQGLGERP